MTKIREEIGVGGGSPYDPSNVAITGGLITGTKVREIIVYNNVDTTINLTVNDLDKIWVIENAAAVTVNYPSASESEIESWIEFRKRGSGNLTINRSGAILIAGEVKIENLVAAQIFAFIRLVLETETSLGIQGMLGSWTD